MRGIGIVKGLNLSIVQGGSHANQNQTRSLNKMAARCDRLRRLSTNTSRYLAHHRQPAATPCDLSQVAPVVRVNEGQRELIDALGHAYPAISRHHNQHRQYQFTALTTMALARVEVLVADLILLRVRGYAMRCPPCAAFPSLTHKFLDSSQGTIRLYQCKHGAAGFEMIERYCRRNKSAPSSF